MDLPVTLEVVMAEKNDMPEIKKELLPLPDLSRRRSKSDATQYKQLRRSSTQLPEITVEDCSDKQTELESAESDDFFDIHLTGPIRPRANTCPESLFKRNRPDRPPTPPPLEGKKLTWKEMTRSSSKEKVSFAPHKLTKVTEDIEFKTDPVKFQDSSNMQLNSSIQRPSSMSRTVGLTECG